MHEKKLNSFKRPKNNLNMFLSLLFPFLMEYIKNILIYKYIWNVNAHMVTLFHRLLAQSIKEKSRHTLPFYLLWIKYAHFFLSAFRDEKRTGNMKKILYFTQNKIQNTKTKGRNSGKNVQIWYEHHFFFSL